VCEACYQDQQDGEPLEELARGRAVLQEEVELAPHAPLAVVGTADPLGGASLDAAIAREKRLGEKRLGHSHNRGRAKLKEFDFKGYSLL
jgi:hypothetical protein